MWLPPYLALGVGLLLSRSVFVFVPVQTLAASQEAVFTWFWTIMLVLAGGGVLFLAQGTHLTSNWHPPTKIVVVHAGMLGAGFGVGIVFLDILFGLTVPHVPFPRSIAFYLFGGIAQELLLRVVPLTLVVWLTSVRTSAARWQYATFWVVAIILAVIEPTGILPFVSDGGVPAKAFTFVTVFGMNLVAAELYWRYGFYAAASERLSLYLVWHVLYAG